MTDFENILYRVEDRKAYVTLNRPEKLNALSIALQDELSQAMWEADNDTNVHCVILSGAGTRLLGRLRPDRLDPRFPGDLRQGLPRPGHV